MLRMLGFAVLVAFLALLVIVVLRARDALEARAANRHSVPDRRHEQAIEGARKRLRTAEKAHAKRVRHARKDLVAAGRDPVLTKVGPVILGACTVTVKKAVRELSPSTTFRLDVEGEIRQVVTRRGDREQASRDDQREVYLTLTDDTWADVVKLTPGQLEGARRLEAAGAAAVRNLQSARDDRDARVLAAQEVLEQVLGDTAEIDTARLTLEDLQGVGPRRIDVPEPPPEGMQGPQEPELGWDSDDEDDEDDEDDGGPAAGHPRH